MGRGFLSGLVMLLAAAAGADSVTPVHTADLGAVTTATLDYNYQSAVTVTHGQLDGKATLILGNSTAKTDTAWTLTFAKFPVQAGVEFAVYVCSRGTAESMSGVFGSGSRLPAVRWYGQDEQPLTTVDALGNEIQQDFKFDFRSQGTDWIRFVARGQVPVGAAYARLRLGADTPDIRPGQFLAIGALAYYERGGADAPWTFDAEERLDVRETVGKEDFSKYAGAASTNGVVTFRDDGMTLVDGRPFFPIGPGAFKRCPLNDYSIERGIRELQRIGCNTVHSYDLYPGKILQATLAACEHYGLKYYGELISRDYENAMLRGEARWRAIGEVADALRNRGVLLYWVVGDDTADHRSPEAVMRDTMTIKAADASLKTMSIDVIPAENRYFPYVHACDAVSPEIYPFQTAEPYPDELGKAVKSMSATRDDQRRAGAEGQPIVPVIQAFSGFGSWRRLPTPEELRSVTYATIALGARGATFYTYYSENTDYESIASSSESFERFARLTRELRSLEPLLVERDAPTQPKVTLPSGSEAKVVRLLKAGPAGQLLIAVNYSEVGTEVAFDLGGGASTWEVVSESRQLRAVGGVLSDRLAPRSTHLYHRLLAAELETVKFTGSYQEGIVSGTYWDGEPPSPTKDYRVATTRFLYTPNGGIHAFGGNSLTIGDALNGDNGYAILMLESGVDLTVNDLRLAYGRLGSWSAQAVKLRGNILVAATDPERPFEFYGGKAADVLHLYASVNGYASAQLRTWCDRANETFNLCVHGDAFANYAGTLTLAGSSKFSGETPRAGASTKMTVESGTFGGTLALADDSVLEAASSEVVYAVGNLRLNAGGDYTIRLPFEPATGRSALVKVNGEFENGARTLRLELPGLTAADAAVGPIALMKFAEGTEPTIENFVVSDPDRANLVLATDPADGLPTLYRYQVLTRGHDWGTVTDADWSNGETPSAAYDYRSSANLYSPAVASWRFPGHALMLSGTVFILRSAASEIDWLTVQGGRSYLWGNQGAGDAEKFYAAAAGNYKVSGRIGFAKSDDAQLICQAAGDCSLAIEADLAGGLPNYTPNRNPQGTTIFAQGYSVGGGAYRGYLGLFGDNEGYRGKVAFRYDGTPTDWENTKTVLCIRDGRNLGGPVASRMIDALSFNVRNAVLCPLQSCTLATPNRSLWVNAEGATLEVPAGVELTLEELVWFEAYPLHKTGAGTLVWGAGLNFSGSSTPAQNKNRLNLDAGTLRPLKAASFDGLELTFAEGAELELDIPLSNADGDLGQYGMLNTKWNTPLKVPAAGLKPILRNPNGLKAPGGLKVPICTVNATAAAVIRGDRLLVAPESPFAHCRTEITETANADGSITFAAEFVAAGLTLFIY